MLSQILLGAAAAAGVANAQVTAVGPNGPTNPTAPITGTGVNQTSMARLISLNAVDDFCIFGPPATGQEIGTIEGEVVAWCVQPRNNARVIPDGTFSSVHFVKTPLYWQISGYGDLTKIGIPNQDFGGELDPHGATGAGNPIGGNVTTNATGSDVFYEEWMSFVSFNTFCLRICTAANSTYTAAAMCEHKLDVMGCAFVMPGDQTDNVFTECDADSAYPPGWYPEAGGSFSTFAQRFTGTWGGGVHTIGDTVTPSAPAMTPASSNCKTYSTIGNGIPPAALSTDAVFAYTSGMTFSNLPSSTSAAAASPTISTDASGNTVTVTPTASPAANGDASASAGGSASVKGNGAGRAAVAPLVVAVVAGAASLFV